MRMTNSCISEWYSSKECYDVTSNEQKNNVAQSCYVDVVNDKELLRGIS